MRFSLSIALVTAAIVASSTLATFVPFQPDEKLGARWSKLPLPAKVSYKPTGKDEPSACSLDVTIVTSKCAGGPHRWGSMFQAYDEYSKTSWTVSPSNKASDHDLYSKYHFVAKCGTNGRIFPTDQIENIDQITYQGVRFFNTADYAAAWVEEAPKDSETGEDRITIAKLRSYYFSGTPTTNRNIVDYSVAKFGWDNSRLVSQEQNAKLYVEFCQ